MSEYTIKHEKADAFYSIYERKSELQHQTHYCPGCGHGITHKLIAEAIDALGVQDRTILVSPVGCSVFAYYYFDVGNIQVAHGRAPAAATATKRARPESIVLSYQGDGDLASIGLAEIVHAANRGEGISVFFLNNAIYGMTGGQMAPTTLLGQKSTTSPFGRSMENDGAPLHMCELLATLEAPVYIERVALGSNKMIMQAARAVKRAIENQVRGIGFSFLEVLSPCPTIWKREPVDAQRWVREEMAKVFVPGVYRDRTKAAVAKTALKAKPPLSEIPHILGLTGVPSAASPNGATADLRIKVAGFGGQGVLLLGELLAAAGLESGQEVSWLPSYGPEMRSGTSNCHVRIASRPVDSPVVSRPNVLLALNEPSLRKFLPTVDSGGWVFYNGDGLPEQVSREDVRFVALPFSDRANELGESKAANIVMLGAFLSATGALSRELVDGVLSRHVRSPRWLEIDRKALDLGIELAKGVA